MPSLSLLPYLSPSLPFLSLLPPLSACTCTVSTTSLFLPPSPFLLPPSLLQAIAEMIQFCRQELFPRKTLHVQGWALIEAAGYRSGPVADCVPTHFASVCVCVCVCVCVHVRFTSLCLFSSFVDSSEKEEDCVVLQCREKNQLCVARSVHCLERDQICTYPLTYTVVYMTLYVLIQCM